MTGRLRPRAPRWPTPTASLIPAVVSAVLALVVVGPAFGRGVVLSYDLAWSPDPRFTSFALGTSGTAPRAIPSDAFAIVLGKVLGAGLAQALLLWVLLVLAGLGAARLAVLLAPEAGVAPRTVAAVVAIWNPFVLERLVVGHWTVLLAYAAVPHLWVSCVRVRRGESPTWAPAVGVAACGVGGANSLVTCVPAVLIALSAPRPQWRAIAVTTASALGVASAWAMPSLAKGISSAPDGVGAFAATADTPLGVLASLTTGGGFWNAATHPSERAVLLPAVVALILVLLTVGAAAWAAHRRQLLVLVLPGAIGLVAAWLSAVDPAGMWSAVVLHLPGGGVLRDSQKLIGPWVAFSAAGAGVLAHVLAQRWRTVAPIVLALLAGLPIALLPSLAWGVGGRVAAVAVPADLRDATSRLSDDVPGPVGLLPWSQYRRYAWNDDRVSLTLVPRMVSARVVYDDSLPLAHGTVPGEDPVSRDVGRRIADGQAPIDALAAEGVRWVVIEKQTGLPEPEVGSRSARVIHDSDHVRVVELSDVGRPPADPTGRLVLVGWTVSLLTWFLVAACRARQSLRRRGDRLVGFPS